MEQQVALTDAAAQQYLNGIHAAGVVFRNTNDLFVIRKFNIQQIHGVQRRFIPDGHAATLVTVECHTLFPCCHLSSAPFRLHIHF